MTCLIISQDDQRIETLSKAIANSEFHVTLASNAIEGLNLVSDRLSSSSPNFDMVVVDRPDFAFVQDLSEVQDLFPPSSLPPTLLAVIQEEGDELQQYPVVLPLTNFEERFKSSVIPLVKHRKQEEDKVKKLMNLVKNKNKF
jgi:hypothetical protein